MLCGSGIVGTNYNSSLSASLTGGTFTDTSASPTDAIAQYRLTTGAAGAEQHKEGAGGWTGIGTWNTDGETASLFECRWSPTGDTGALVAGSDSLATWLGLGTTRLWGIEDTGGAGPLLQMTGLIEIRDAATLSVIASATLTLEAEEVL